MWSLMSKIGAPEPRFISPMHKGGYHSAVQGLFGGCLDTIQTKDLPYIKTSANLSVHDICQNRPAPDVENSSGMPDSPAAGKAANAPSYACNSNKKKRRKRRRGRHKRKKQQRSNVTQTEAPVTGGTLPVESEDGFVVFVNDEHVFEPLPSARARTLSINSEDSFIVFEEDERPFRERSVSVNSEDSFIVFVDDGHVSEAEPDTETEDFDSLDSVIPNKKVRFASASKLCEVHPMVTWSYAYQAARRGPWEQYARDNARFGNRVRNTEALIGHVFAAGHRSKIFEERFSGIL